jgi:shikimate kinase
MPIKELFGSLGETGFRGLERELLIELGKVSSTARGLAPGTSSGADQGSASGTAQGTSQGIAPGAGAGGAAGGIHFALLRDLAAGRGAVIATGGGLPCERGNMSRMKEIGPVVYLRAGIDDILRRLSRMKDAADRPVFRKMKERSLEKRGAGTPEDDGGAIGGANVLRMELSSLLAARETSYLEADLVVENSDATGREETVRRIVEALDALDRREEA